ncbi:MULTISPECIES: HypC/HybG/HupF family hydrogenase formation chaperone [unclassified Butyrivibrio]|uniref:HypC/HybG/HupF family hydrogenase formation chaperone n=1 Tax=unclassified Butyrivibrio TaxID=2639466 RepID=UPI0008E67EB0|nr:MULTISPECIES: HypC/HybG/HupF family hydrogenase formation chaperone [unclassified Butyrivibrio]RKM58912.1 HypC/HybG/HupF family hydrogenase formation chaperone [Butyrivibrio sp. XB500-5]SFU40048.1 hydrogenase expression/formation protein HypC [Butyrivibrio sp. INlla21]
MCVAIPGTVIALEGTKATVDFSGNKVNAEAGLVDVAVGDKVLVHAGCIIQKMDEQLAKETMDLFKEIEDLMV